MGPGLVLRGVRARLDSGGGLLAVVGVAGRVEEVEGVLCGHDRFRRSSLLAVMGSPLVKLTVHFCVRGPVVAEALEGAAREVGGRRGVGVGSEGVVLVVVLLLRLHKVKGTGAACARGRRGNGRARAQRGLRVGPLALAKHVCVVVARPMA